MGETGDVVMQPKPLFGDACNGCGLCCLYSQCPLSEILFGMRPRCPALLINQLGGYVCGLLATKALDDDQRTAAAVLIGSGAGCDYPTTEDDFRARALRLDGMKARATREVEELPPAARAHVERWRAQRLQG